MRVRRGESRLRILGEILRMRSNEDSCAYTGTPADLEAPSLGNLDGQSVARRVNWPSRAVGFCIATGFGFGGVEKPAARDIHSSLNRFVKWLPNKASVLLYIGVRTNSTLKKSPFDWHSYDSNLRTINSYRCLRPNQVMIEAEHLPLLTPSLLLNRFRPLLLRLYCEERNSNSCNSGFPIAKFYFKWVYLKPRNLSLSHQAMRAIQGIFCG
jgi:hypothetical protein